MKSIRKSTIPWVEMTLFVSVILLGGVALWFESFTMVTILIFLALYSAYIIRVWRRRKAGHVFLIEKLEDGYRVATPGRRKRKLPPGGEWTYYTVSDRHGDITLRYLGKEYPIRSIQFHPDDLKWIKENTREVKRLQKGWLAPYE